MFLGNWTQLTSIELSVCHGPERQAQSGAALLSIMIFILGWPSWIQNWEIESFQRIFNHTFICDLMCWTYVSVKVFWRDYQKRIKKCVGSCAVRCIPYLLCYLHTFFAFFVGSHSISIGFSVINASQKNYQSKYFSFFPFSCVEFSENVWKKFVNVNCWKVFHPNFKELLWFLFKFQVVCFSYECILEWEENP